MGVRAVVLQGPFHTARSSSMWTLHNTWHRLERHTEIISTAYSTISCDEISPTIKGTMHLQFENQLAPPS